MDDNIVLFESRVVKSNSGEFKLVQLNDVKSKQASCINVFFNNFFLKSNDQYEEKNYIVHLRYCNSTGLNMVKDDNEIDHMLGQDYFIQGQSKSNCSSLSCRCPIIHMIDDSSYVDVLYGDKKLKPRKRREYEIMDNSIWNYMVPISETQGGELLKMALMCIYNNYEMGLYNLNVVNEYSDWNSRLFRESYLAGKEGHGLSVSPFIFHSESAIHFKMKDSFKTLRFYLQTRKTKWRFLLVDDHSESALSVVKSEDVKKVISKNAILKRLLENELYPLMYNEQDNHRDKRIEFRVFDNTSSAQDLDDKKTDIVVEYVESLEGAKKALKEKKYDIILLDYLLDKKRVVRNYGYELLKDIADAVAIFISFNNIKKELLKESRLSLGDILLKPEFNELKKFIDDKRIKIPSTLEELKGQINKKQVCVSSPQSAIPENKKSDERHSFFEILSLPRWLNAIKRQCVFIQGNKVGYKKEQPLISEDKEHIKKLNKQLEEVYYELSMPKKLTLNDIILRPEFRTLKKAIDAKKDINPKDLSLQSLKDKVINNYKYIIGPRDKYFFMFISAYSSAVRGRLLALGLNQSEDYWYINTGACPINTPQLFLYNLLKLMEKRLDDSGITKLSHQAIIKTVADIYGPDDRPVRDRANDHYQDILSMQYHYRRMIKDVEYPQKNKSLFSIKNSVLMTSFVQKNEHLGGLLEHLTQMVHLTAFGTTRQWSEIWEEYLFFRDSFKREKLDEETKIDFEQACEYIEKHVLKLKRQQR